MLRAVFEGVAFSIAEAATSLPEFGGAASLYLAGGASPHPSWRKLLCDVLGKKLLVIENPNASALGAALLGAQAAGLIVEISKELTFVDEVEPDPVANRLLAGTFEHCKEAATDGTRRSLPRQDQM